MDSAATPEPQVVFRGKKRKAYRQKPRTDDDADTQADPKEASQAAISQSSQPTPQPDNASASPLPPSASPPAETLTAAKDDDDDEQDQGLSVAEALRRRNARKAKLRGVAFGADGPSRPDALANPSDALDLMIREEAHRADDASATAAAVTARRFAPQTGLTGELVNKHMMEYIESELAKRHSTAIPSSSEPETGITSKPSSQPSHDPSDKWRTTAAPANAGRERPPSEKHRALQGKLMEIDLGDEVRSRNKALTDRAARKLMGEAVEDEEDEDSGKPAKKVRLGKDGKPWRPRNRRASDDIKRDQMVEALLHENKLDMYDNPDHPATRNGPRDGAQDAEGDEEEWLAGDDRVAEQFRREFMQAIASRQNRRRAAINAPPKGKQAIADKKKRDEEILRGPKLGGSRNQRAAMRDILLEKEKERKREAARR